MQVQWHGSNGENEQGGEPSLARVVSAAGVQPTRPDSIPVGDDPRVSPGKIPQREAERVCGVC